MKYLTIIAIIIFMTACWNQESKQEPKEVISHESQGDVVTLENGEKWKVNFATNKGIRNMIKLTDDVKPDYTLSDYRGLGANLQKEFQHIFQRCDMTGEAHNQLHNYLHPMSGWFKELKGENLNQCKSATNSLRTHLELFNKYFK